MHAELVYDGTGHVHVPACLGTPRDDQMKGTWAEQLTETCGRVCYDSMGTGRPSGDYHKNLFLAQRHFSVAEHVHVTAEVRLDPIVWLGIPDVSAVQRGGGIYRVTFNLRHILEWPNNVTFKYKPASIVNLLKEWELVLVGIGYRLAPSIYPNPPMRSSTPWSLVEPQTDTEAFVSMFLEDSRVWSHEQVRHRGNISQRSGRFVDETDRKYCVHPLLRDYLNELGYLPGDDRSAVDTVRSGAIAPDSLFEGSPVKLSREEKMERLAVGKAVEENQVNSQLTYQLVVNRLQKYAESRLNLDKVTARKQARSAARYYLGNGISTEGVFTSSIRHWRQIFSQRCSPHADAAIRELMSECRSIVAKSNYGYML